MIIHLSHTSYKQDIPVKQVKWWPLWSVLHDVVYSHIKFVWHRQSTNAQGWITSRVLCKVQCDSWRPAAMEFQKSTDIKQPPWKLSHLRREWMLWRERCHYHQSQTTYSPQLSRTREWYPRAIVAVVRFCMTQQPGAEKCKAGSVRSRVQRWQAGTATPTLSAHTPMSPVQSKVGVTIAKEYRHNTGTRGWPHGVGGTCSKHSKSWKAINVLG